MSNDKKPPSDKELRAVRPTVGSAPQKPAAKAGGKSVLQANKGKTMPPLEDTVDVHADSAPRSAAPQSGLKATAKTAAKPAGKAGAKAKGKPPVRDTQPRPRDKGPGWFSRIFMALISMAVLGAIAAVGLVVALLFYFSQDLPDYSALATYEPPIVTRAYANDGRLLAEFAAEKRVFVSVPDVPDLVIHAFLSAEDKNFYKHPGIDATGVARAIRDNLIHMGSSRRLVGASTITQQVAKNFLLSDGLEDERGNDIAKFKRKFREIILSFRIEQALSKDRILELYLNEIFLGARAYGVAAASLEYFNKPLNELTIEEAAYLAALPKGPNNYHPERRYEAAVGRRNWVIDQMLENGYVGAEDAAKAKDKPLKTHRRDSDQYVNHPYFAEEVRRRLLELYGEKGLYEGGLIARSTLIPEYQQAAEKALRAGLVDYDMRRGLRADPLGHIDGLDDWQKKLGEIARPAGAGDFESAVVLESGEKQATMGLRDGSKATVPFERMRWARKRGAPEVKQVSDVLKKGDVWLIENTGGKGDKATWWLRQIPEIQGGIIAMNPHNGRIFAMAGGFSYEISQFNRASQAIRQPGSAFKPFVYLAGLEAGFTPATLVLDAPFVMEQGPGLQDWRPKNYSADYGGPTTLRVGLEKYRNLMTIRLANYVGMDRIAEICREFGVTDNLPKMLSMSIGAGETTLQRMVSAYSIFVNGGKKITPTVIDRVQDRTGKTIFVHDRRPCDGCGPMIPWNGQETPDVPDTREQIADPRLMYQMVSMMEGVVQRGTATALNSLDRPLAGKTGTTNQSKDAWFVGFTPDLVIGVYVGFDDPRPMGAKETGGRVAVPVVKDFVQHALKDVPPVPFRMPEGMRLVMIDPASGTRAGAATDKPILEAFITGTEPGEEPMMFTGQGVSSVSDVTNVGESVNTGLGGIY